MALEYYKYQGKLEEITDLSIYMLLVKLNLNLAIKNLLLKCYNL